MGFRSEDTGSRVSPQRNCLAASIGRKSRPSKLLACEGREAGFGGHRIDPPITAQTGEIACPSEDKLKADFKALGFYGT